MCRDDSLSQHIVFFAGLKIAELCTFCIFIIFALQTTLKYDETYLSIYSGRNDRYRCHG